MLKKRGGLVHLGLLKIYKAEAVHGVGIGRNDIQLRLKFSRRLRPMGKSLRMLLAMPASAISAARTW